VPRTQFILIPSLLRSELRLTSLLVFYFYIAYPYPRNCLLTTRIHGNMFRNELTLRIHLYGNMFVTRSIAMDLYVTILWHVLCNPEYYSQKRCPLLGYDRIKIGICHAKQRNQCEYRWKRCSLSVRADIDVMQQWSNCGKRYFLLRPSLGHITRTKSVSQSVESLTVLNLQLAVGRQNRCRSSRTAASGEGLGGEEAPIIVKLVTPSIVVR
jgi:hypothetical protein